MDLLPKVYSEFSSAKYWENFFTKRVQSFEWYGNYFELCGILHRYIKPKDDILVIGCGNSELSENLYDSNYHKIINIDISSTVINQMQIRNAFRAEMKWLEMDITDLSLEDSSCSVVLDKGTLDAMMSDTSDQVSNTIDKMFKEISRVLRTGGRYICVTLAQDHIMKKILEYFPANNWLVRIHKVWTACGDNEGHIQMPVFAFVLTKLINLPQKILEVCLDDSIKPTRLETKEDAIEFVTTQQYYAMVQNELSHGEAKNDLPPIELFSSEMVNVPRYRIHVLDSKHHQRTHHYGIFIVPQGRELQWLFNSNEGRQQVAKSAQFKRLAFVSLSRDHVYEGGMKRIQSELSMKVMELAPSNLPKGYKVPFLSIGGDNIGERIVRFKGQSSFTGSIVVEDFIGDENSWYRQLLFESALVQSIIRLKRECNIKSDGGKKKRNQQQHGTAKEVEMKDLVPDPSYFTSEYLLIMIAGLTGVIETLDDKLNLLIIGLGGGSLAMHLLHMFKNCSVTAVELDPAIVDVAQSWFGISEEVHKPRLKIHVADGLDFVKSHAKSIETSEDREKQYDVIIVDVDTKDDSLSLRCPPPDFVSKDYLESLSQSLTAEGILIMNILSRDQRTKEKVRKGIQEIFPQVYNTKCDSDVNEILFCYKNIPSSSLKAQSDGEATIDKWKSKAKSWERVWRKNNANKHELELCKILEKVVKIY